MGAALKKRLGEILIERQLITVDQLNTALAHQRQWSMRLGAALVAKGFITEAMLTRVLSEFLAIPMVDLSKVVVDQKALELVAVTICEQHDVFPITLKQQKGRRVLVLAMADPLDVSAIDELAFRTGCSVQPAIAQLSSLDQAIRRFYHGQKTVEIAPLDFERTPLTRTGQPAVSRLTPIPPSKSTPVPSLDFDSLVERPALGGPGRAPAPPLPSLPAVAVPGEVPDDELPLLDVFGDESTGTYAVVAPREAAAPVSPIPPQVKHLEWDATESMEVRFWALMRVLSKRGLLTKEEFLTELRWRE